MSILSKDDPKYWHNPDGSHRMTDPRKVKDRDGVYTYPRQFWDAADREYVAHLEEHERRVSDPQPEEGDSERVVGLFALIRSCEEKIQLSKALIVALRQGEQQEKEGQE